MPVPMRYIVPRPLARVSTGATHDSFVAPSLRAECGCSWPVDCQPATADSGYGRQSTGQLQKSLHLRVDQAIPVSMHRVGIPPPLTSVLMGSTHGSLIGTWRAEWGRCTLVLLNASLPL
eukprot:366367-Chlamydomonas_euryale.AAC.1